MSSTCIFCSRTGEMTDEHIVPEGMGGTLMIKAVCKSCNDRMGSDFEGTTINSFLFETPRYVHGIKGKRTEPPNPFRKPGVLPNGLKVRLTDALAPYLIPSVKEERMPDGSMRVSLTLDAADENDTERILLKVFRRYYREQHESGPSINFESKAAEAVAEAMLHLRREENSDPIQMSFSIDLTALRLTYLKIAFETGWHHFGDSYLQDRVAIEIRDTVNSRLEQALIRGQVPTEHNELSQITNVEDCHSVMLINNSCYINLFGLAGVVEMCDQGGAFNLGQENAVIYHHNYVNGGVTITPLVQHLANFLSA